MSILNEIGDLIDSAIGSQRSGPLAGLSNEGYRQGRNDQDTLTATEMNEVLSLAQRMDLRGQIRVIPGRDEGTYEFSYRENGRILATRDLRVDDAALDMAHRSPMINWDVPANVYAPRAAVNVTPEIEGQRVALVNIGSQMEALRDAAPNEQANLANHLVQTISEFVGSDDRITLPVGIQSSLYHDGRIDLPAGTYSANALGTLMAQQLGLSEEDLEATRQAAERERSRAAAPAAAAPAAAPSAASGTTDFVAMANSHPDGRNIVDEREAMTFVREHAAHFTQPSNSASSAQPAPAAAAPAPAPAAVPVPDAPAIEYETSNMTVIDRLGASIGTIAANRAANDSAHAVENFLRTALAEGQTAATGAGFADDGILTAQESTAALNRMQALNFNDAGRAQIAALEAALPAQAATEAANVGAALLNATGTTGLTHVASNGSSGTARGARTSDDAAVGIV